MTGDPRPIDADVVIAGSRIGAIGPSVDAPADAEVLDRRGHYVIPGLVQTHLHLVQTLFRGMSEDLTLLDWLRRRIWPLEAAHDEASVRASVRLGVPITSGASFRGLNCSTLTPRNDP